MKAVSKLVTSGSTYGKLGKQLSAQRALHQKLKQLLPSPLDSQLKAAVLQHGKLTLFVPSPVWASRYRYLLPQLQTQLQKYGIDAAKVRTSILPDEIAKPLKRKKRTPPVLSRAASKQIREIAKTIKDPSLQEALNRLSRHSGHI